MTDTPNPTAGGPKRGRLKLLAVLLVCAAPVIASYFTYYVIRPDGRVNYADLIEPQVALGDLRARRLDGEPVQVSQLRGKWVMVMSGPSTCDAACVERLYHIRQVRLTTGRERDRVERLWLLTDAGSPDSALLAQHEGLVVWRFEGGAPDPRLTASAGHKPEDHVYIIDPLGNLMMRFPAQADPSKMKKDLNKLLRASRIG